MDSDFISFWKINFYDCASNPSEAITALALDWGQHCYSESTLFPDDEFVRWWEKRKYPYAERPSPLTINVCQSWAANRLEQRKSRQWSDFEKWLLSTGKPFPPFQPSECALVWSRKDAWARHPDTDRWWYMRVESPAPEWIESLKTCSRYELSH